MLVIAPGTPGIPVFAEPNEQARLIGFAADSVLLNVLGEDDSGLWYQICCVEQQAGWLKVDAIPDTVVEPADTTGHTTLDEKRTQDNAVAVADAEASPAPTSTSTETPIPTATPSETPVVTPTATPTASRNRQRDANCNADSPPTASPRRDAGGKSAGDLYADAVVDRDRHADAGDYFTGASATPDGR